MFKPTNINSELNKTRSKFRKQEDVLLDEVKNILNADLLHENKVLNHLKFYNQTFELINETDVEKHLIYSEEEIKIICTNHRLRFLDSQIYKKEIPYEAVLKIRDLNLLHRKDLKSFKILAPAQAFKKEESDLPCLLFAQTLSGNYYLIHSWGKELSYLRKWFVMPMRTFESLFISLLLLTLIIDVSLPVRLITLDRSAPYWCGYRIATYFHLLIFFCGFTTYTIFAFHYNFSKSDWNNPKI